MIEVEKLNVKYKKSNYAIKVLNNISFKIDDNSSLVITGESGVGKTTLIKAMLGFLPDNAIVSGKIKYKDKTYDLAKTKPEQLINDSFYVPQHILSSLSQVHTIGTLCLDFVKSKKDKFDIDEIKNEFKTVLKDVQIHRDVWNLYPFQLSGGQLQRVIISIAILLKTEVIFLDEPTSALDQINQKNMIKVLKKVNDKYKISLVIISHSEKVITEFSRNNLYLAKGDNYGK